MTDIEVLGVRCPLPNEHYRILKRCKLNNNSPTMSYDFSIIKFIKNIIRSRLLLQIMTVFTTKKTFIHIDFAHRFSLGKKY